MPNFDYAVFFNAIDGSTWLAAMGAWLAYLLGWIQIKYAEAPALVLGLGVALALPAIATTGAIVRLLLRGSRAPDIDPIPTVKTRPLSAWRQSAFLVLAGNNSYEINQGMVRIGRESDNDLCLSDPTVHRYHAVLERSPDAEFMISYIGDPDHDGLLINGRAAQRQRLRGGEVLEIGSIKLRFALSPA